MRKSGNGKPSASPTPEESKGEVLLDFFDAMREVFKGKKVTRREWDNENIYVFLHDDYLRIVLDNGTFSNLIVRSVDMMGMDWYIV